MGRDHAFVIEGVRAGEGRINVLVLISMCEEARYVDVTKAWFVEEEGRRFALPILQPAAWIISDY